MSERASGPSPSKIIVSADEKQTSRPSGPRGQKTRSWAAIAACFFPLLGFGLGFVLGGVMGGGNTESRYYILGILTLLFILGSGAGMGLSAAFEPRRNKLAPILSIVLNGGAFLLVLLLSLFPAEEAPPQEFETLQTPDSAAVSGRPPETGG